LLDEDGTATGFKGGGLIGADDTASETGGTTNDWWRLDGRCSKENFGGFWGCPRTPVYGKQSREVVAINIYALDGRLNGRYDTRRAVPGIIYHFGSMRRKLRVGFASNLQVTGACCDIGWYFVPDRWPSAGVSFVPTQMVPTGGLIVALTLPAGATPAIKSCLNWNKCTNSMRVGSKSAFLGDTTGKLFYRESDTIFFRMVNAKNTYYNYNDGAKLLVNTAQGGVRYHVNYKDGRGAPKMSLPKQNWLEA
jgi:hypothetical protein